MENNTTGFENQDETLRLFYDSLISEYESVRKEIELRVNLAETTVTYLLLLIGALLSASHIFSTNSSKIGEWLNTHPSVYWALAFLTLWFPTNDLLQNIHLNTLGGYIVNVLSPKMNYLQERLSKNPIIRDYKEWEKKFPVNLRGSFRWDSYRNEVQFQKRMPLVILGIISAVRYPLQYVPALIFSISYFVAIWKKEFFYLNILFFLPIFIIAISSMVGYVICAKIYTMKT